MITNKQIHELTLESLRDWFKKEKWVRISSSGNIAGPCGTSKNKKNPDRCLPKAKAQSLTKNQRAATARKKKKAGAKGKTVVKNTKKATVKKEVMVNEGNKEYIKVKRRDYKKAVAVIDSALENDVYDVGGHKLDIVDNDGAGNVIFYISGPEARAMTYDAMVYVRNEDIDIVDSSVKDNEDLMNEYVLGSRHGSLVMKFKDLEAEIEKIADEGDFVVRRKSNPSDKVQHEWEIVPIGDVSSGEEKSGIRIYDFKFPFDPAKHKTDQTHSFSVGGVDKMNTLSILKHLFGSEAKASHSDINMNDVDPDAWVNSPYGQSEMDEDKGMEISKKNYADHFKTTGMKQNKKINEVRGDMDIIKGIIRDRANESGFEEREEAAEVIAGIAEEYMLSLKVIQAYMDSDGPVNPFDINELDESRYTKIRNYYRKIDQLKQSSQKEYEKRKEAEKAKKTETANPQDGKSAPYGSGYKPVKELTKEDIANLITGLIHEAQGKEVLMEKDDRCTRIAKRKYDTWPSAYASGAVVRCRRGEIWKKEK